MQLDLRTKLDRYDRAIVRSLQLDGRITNSQLAEGVSLSESACLRRVRALEEAGFIEGYTALINQQNAGILTVPRVTSVCRTEARVLGCHAGMAPVLLVR